MDYNLIPKYFKDFRYHTEIIKKLEMNLDEKIINSIFAAYVKHSPQIRLHGPTY